MLRCGDCSVERRMRTLALFTLLLTVLAVTTAGSGSQEDGASFTWTGRHRTREVTVVIDGYTHNSTLTSGDSVPLGTQLILVCRVVGLPYGTPLSYTWTCPNEPCEVEGFYGRRIYNEHILAVNTSSMHDGGEYTCQAGTSAQTTTGSFTFSITGGRVVHSYGRLIPHHFPITNIPDSPHVKRNGYRITCTTGSRTEPDFHSPNGTLTAEGVTESTPGLTQSTTLVTITPFQGWDMYCVDSDTNYFYLYLTASNNTHSLGMDVKSVTSSQVVYLAAAHGNLRVITGYEVMRFGVPMIGEYSYVGTGKRDAITSAVPGAQYRITAWALHGGEGSATPAVRNATTREASPSPPRHAVITTVFQDGVELNWLPPTEPNGEVHYVVEYKREGIGNWTSVNTTSDSTHYILTGLHSGANYIIRVGAVNSAGESLRINIVDTSGGTVNMAGVLIGVPVALVLLSLILTAVVYIGTLLCRTPRQQERISELPVVIEESQVMSSTVEVASGARLVEEGDSTAYHNFDHMDEETPPCTGRAGRSYQDLDEEIRDCSSVYDRLGRGSYQNLDSLELEEAHRYQRFVGKRERHWERK